MLVYSPELQEVFSKSTRNKHCECDLSLVSLHFNEELDIIYTEFGSEFGSKFNECVTELCNSRTGGVTSTSGCL